MSHYYTVPERVQAAQWVKGDADKQSRVLALLMEIGLTVTEASTVGANFTGGTVANGEWVVVSRSTPSDIQVDVLTDAEFTSRYCTNPRIEADLMAQGRLGEDEPDESEES